MNWRIFITLFSYLRIAAGKKYYNKILLEQIQITYPGFEARDLERLNRFDPLRSVAKSQGKPAEKQQRFSCLAQNGSNIRKKSEKNSAKLSRKNRCLPAASRIQGVFLCAWEINMALYQVRAQPTERRRFIG